MEQRCSNCGLKGHKEKVCPRYGPYYPEPGKTREDYADLIAKIANLNAQDIILEHRVGEPEDPAERLSPRPRGGVKPISAREERSRTIDCDTCGSSAGMPCLSPAGMYIRSHKSRNDRANSVEVSTDER